MHIDEMNKKIMQIKDKCTIDVNKIKVKFAYDNNPYKVGDIIEGSSCRIKIESMSSFISYGNS